MKRRVGYYPIVGILCLILFACSDTSDATFISDTDEDRETIDSNADVDEIPEGDTEEEEDSLFERDRDETEDWAEEIENDADEDADVFDDAEENDLSEEEESDIDQGYEDCLLSQQVNLTPVAEERTGACQEYSPIDWYSYPSNWGISNISREDIFVLGDDHRFCFVTTDALFCTVGEERRFTQLVMPFAQYEKIDKATFKQGTAEYWFVTEKDHLGYWDLNDATLHWVVADNSLPSPFASTWEGIAFDTTTETSNIFLIGKDSFQVYLDGSWKEINYPIISLHDQSIVATYPQYDGRFILGIRERVISDEDLIYYLTWDDDVQEMKVLATLPEDYSQTSTHYFPTLSGDHFTIFKYDYENESNTLLKYDLNGNFLSEEPIVIPGVQWIRHYRETDQAKYYATGYKVWSQTQDGQWASLDYSVEHHYSLRGFSIDGSAYLVDLYPLDVQRSDRLEPWRQVIDASAKSYSRLYTYVSPEGGIWMLYPGSPLMHNPDGCTWETASCRPLGTPSIGTTYAATGGWSENDVLATSTDEGVVWRLHDSRWERLFAVDFNASITEITTAGEGFAGLLTDYWLLSYYRYLDGAKMWFNTGIEYNPLYQYYYRLFARAPTSLYTYKSSRYGLLEEGEVIGIPIGGESLSCLDLDVVGSLMYWTCGEKILIFDEENDLIGQWTINGTDSDRTSSVQMILDEDGPIASLDDDGCFWLFEENSDHVNEFDMVETGYCFPSVDRLFRIAENEYVATGPSGAWVRFVVR